MKPASCMILMAIASIVILLCLVGFRSSRGGGQVVHADTSTQSLMAAPGRIEGTSETVGVAAGLDGVLATVLVDDGDLVTRGQTVAQVHRADVVAEAAAARAALAASLEQRTRILRGNRDEVKQSAAERTATAQAMAVEARSRHDRFLELFREAVISRAELDQSNRDKDVAEASLRLAISDEKLANAGALPEEIARANAEVDQARNRVKMAEANASKTDVRAPISGKVIKVLMHAGEAVSTVNPQPIVLIADTSALRVRAEVDERDVAHVRVGQKATIVGEGLGSQELSGTVISVAAAMGRKRVRSGDPAEKSDRDVLDTLVALDPRTGTLPIGLRVTVRFLR